MGGVHWHANFGSNEDTFLDTRAVIKHMSRTQRHARHQKLIIGFDTISFVGHGIDTKGINMSHKWIKTIFFCKPTSLMLWRQTVYVEFPQANKMDARHKNVRASLSRFVISTLKPMERTAIDITCPLLSNMGIYYCESKTLSHGMSNYFQSRRRGYTL